MKWKKKKIAAAVIGADKASNTNIINKTNKRMKYHNKNTTSTTTNISNHKCYNN